MYNFSSYDSRQKFGHDHLGKSSYGKNKIIYQYELDDKDGELDDKDDELDEFVYDINKKIKQKIAPSGKIKITDTLAGRQDNAGPAKNQPMGLMEYDGDHMTYAKKGISPFKQKKHTGGPIGTGGSGQAFKTTGNYKRTGSFFGYSRPHKILTDVEDENIFNLKDMLNPIERSFNRQQNRIKKLFSIINEHML